jgi:hypothetical protein
MRSIKCRELGMVGALSKKSETSVDVNEIVAYLRWQNFLMRWQIHIFGLAVILGLFIVVAVRSPHVPTRAHSRPAATASVPASVAIRPTVSNPGAAPASANVSPYSAVTAPATWPTASRGGSLPVITVPNPQPSRRVSGASSARIQAGERILELTPDQSGNFPSVPVSAQARVPIQVLFANGQPGDVVAVQAEDGGQLPNGTIFQTVRLDENRVASFVFQVTAQNGTHRVSLQHGGDLKVLDFWVGPPLGTRTGSIQ